MAQAKETVMTQACNACASLRVLRDAQVACRGFMGPYTVRVQGPTTSLLKGPIQSAVLAQVCVDCGHIELRATGLAALEGVYKTLSGSTPLGLNS